MPPLDEAYGAIHHRLKRTPEFPGADLATRSVGPAQGRCLIPEGIRPAVSRRPGARRDSTPDAHLFATRPYDLIKEFVVALIVVGVLTGLLAAIPSSPDRTAVSLSSWARAAPDDVVGSVSLSVPVIL